MKDETIKLIIEEIRKIALKYEMTYEDYKRLYDFYFTLLKGSDKSE